MLRPHKDVIGKGSIICAFLQNNSLSWGANTRCCCELFFCEPTAGLITSSILTHQPAKFIDMLLPFIMGRLVQRVKQKARHI